MTTSDQSTFDDFLTRIAAADRGAVLCGLRSELASTKGILDAERAEISEAINRRFAKLNAKSVGLQKPRWSSVSHP